MSEIYQVDKGEGYFGKGYLYQEKRYGKKGVMFFKVYKEFGVVKVWGMLGDVVEELG